LHHPYSAYLIAILLFASQELIRLTKLEIIFMEVSLYLIGGVTE